MARRNFNDLLAFVTVAREGSFTRAADRLHVVAPGDVLDGELDPFMAAALSQRVTGEKVEVEDVD